MEWWLILIVIFGAFFALMLIGMPVAFAFLLVNFVAAFLIWQGMDGLVILVGSIREGIGNFSFMPLPLFVLMGEVISQSGVAARMLDSFDKWLGRVPGRLGMLAVGAGTLFGALTGSSMASVAMLGSTLAPEMEKRGYKKAMTLGPIIGSAGLAIMIPPSATAVILASMADVSIGKLLIAIIIPGLMMAVLYATYTIVRCQLQPSIAPPYDVPSTPLLEKVVDIAKYVLPFGIVIFLVTGVIFLGIATPTEAAATGAVGAIILVACYRRLTWPVMKNALTATVNTTVMILLILAAASVFSQVLAFSQATRGLINFALSFPVSPIMIIIAMHFLVLVLGSVMSTMAVMMVTIPVYMPIVLALGFDPIWFVAILLLNTEVGACSPPFGTTLFVMKGVAPPDTTMGDIYKSILPYIGCDLIVIALMLAFPIIPLFLPGMM